MAAVMALHAGRIAMHRQTRAAAQAIGLPPARGPLERWPIAEAVDEHERLLAARKACAERVPQRTRNSVAGAFAAIRDQRDPRQLRARVCAPWKRQAAIPSCAGPRERFERWR